MTRRLPVAVAVAALLAGALSWATAAPAMSDPAADPAAGAPTVGQCSAMTAAELDQESYAGAPVDCASAHTARVVAVPQLPEGLSYAARGVTRFVLEACFPAQRRALGITLRGTRLTAYDLVWFTPTADQQAAGARWVRCDLVLRDDDVLLPLPTDPRLGARPWADGVSRCLAGRDAHVTVCARPHTFRATDALRAGGRTYRSRRAWIRLATDRCRDVVGSRTYRFAWPTRVAWNAGDRTLVCYTRTRD